MARFKVFINEPADGSEKAFEVLSELGCEVVLGRPVTQADKGYTEDEMVDLVGDVDVLMGSSREGYTRRIMEAAPKLRAIAKFGRGIDKIDIAAATQLGILVANTPVNDLAVAESTVTFILGLAKKLKTSDTAVRRGFWRQEGFGALRHMLVNEKTVGIIGLGRIGSKVALLLQPWGVKIVAYDPYVPSSRAVSLDVKIVDLNTLLRESDFVTIHAVATPETNRMIGEKEIRLMKQTAFIVNTARGSLVDEQALAEALKQDRIAGAALDVFDPEPPTQDNPLLSPDLEERIWLSPHAASNTPETREQMAAAWLDNCVRALSGAVPEFIVNPEAIPRWRERVSRLGSLA